MITEKLEFDRKDPNLVVKLMGANVPKETIIKWVSELETSYKPLYAFSLPNYNGVSYEIVIK